MHDMMAGYMGNRPLVNGTLDARLEVPRGTVRFRLVNGSNGSFYSLRFADGRMMTQIGSDGGLLPAPVTGATLLLAPAERAEILVDFADDRTVMLQAAAWGSETGPASATLVDFLDIRPVLADRGLFAAPGRLSDLAPPDPDASVNRRDLVLEMRRGMGMSFTINDRLMDMARIDFTVPVDTLETWTIRNTTPMFHPIHIHDTQFRILSRNGAPPPAAESGLKDTVLTAPGEVIEVQCRFADYADPVVPYMFHCHVLEHEDAGMMGQFTVV
jgi:FtsP/CotA-like multicopper oxidase with cupredoxin domain